MSWRSRKRVIFVVHIDGDELTGVWFGGSYVALLRGRDKDCVTRVSSLTNEEPLGVVQLGVDVVWEVV